MRDFRSTGVPSDAVSAGDMALDWVLGGHGGRFLGLELALVGDRVGVRGQGPVLEEFLAACLRRGVLVHQHCAELPSEGAREMLSHTWFVPTCKGCGQAVSEPVQLVGSGWHPSVARPEVCTFPGAILPPRVAWQVPPSFLQWLDAPLSSSERAFLRNRRRDPRRRWQDAPPPDWVVAARQNRFFNHLQAGDHLVDPSTLSWPALHHELDPLEPDACCGLSNHAPLSGLFCACCTVRIGRCWSDCGAVRHAQLLHTAVEMKPGPEGTSEVVAIGQPPIRDLDALLMALNVHTLEEVQQTVLWFDWPSWTLPELPEGLDLFLFGSAQAHAARSNSNACRPGQDVYVDSVQGVRERGLLMAATSCSDRGNRSARLVLADWWLGNNVPQGEFIGIQCRLEGDGLSKEERGALRKRERAMLATHGGAWLAALGLRPAEATFAGGLVERLSLTGERLEVAVMGLAGRARAVRSLTVRGSIDPGVLARSLSALPALTALKLQVDWLSGAVGEVLAASQLALTDLDCDQLGDSDVAALVSSPHLAHLECLHLGGEAGEEGVLGDDGARALAASTHLRGLTNLTWVGAWLTPPVAVALAGSPVVQGLKRFSLWVGDPAPGMWEALIPALPRGRLRHLVLGPLGPACTAQLARCGVLAEITGLNLSGALVQDAGTVALAGSADVARLERLVLSHDEVGDAGAVALAAAHDLQRLTHLDLGFNRIGDAGARALAASPRLPRLEVLDLRGNPIEAEGRRALRLRFGAGARLS